jgi:3-dehydroquinate dehydratase II
MKTTLLINGPNLSLLGKRQPEIYGSKTLAEIELELSQICGNEGSSLQAFQSDCEGQIVSFLGSRFLEVSDRKLDCNGIIINPGAYTHTSVAIRDALACFHSTLIPIVEVHISNVFTRESFRHHSYISPVASGVICGLGTHGYILALEFILRQSQKG